jgi:hypothetical protein
VGGFWPSVIGRPLHALGFQQAWDVFAPEPVHREVRFEARVAFADGSEVTWHTPSSGALSAVGSHRWELWEDRIVDDAYAGWWESSARWIARQHVGDGREPVRVALRRRWSDLPPPGVDPSLRAWNEFEFYVLELT